MGPSHLTTLNLSQPGIGAVLGARVLAEFGDAKGRYADAKSRKNYAGTAPITRQSGKTKTVHARFIHNDRLLDALHMQAGAAILHDEGVRAYYDQLRARHIGHNAALRQIGNRLVGILHGCLKTTTLYNQTTAWSHRTPHPSLTSQLLGCLTHGTRKDPHCPRITNRLNADPPAVPATDGWKGRRCGMWQPRCTVWSGRSEC